ncbi:MAG TPA: serine/threonine-protein kinase [Thermoanaerobaculia bacterium]|nr:serine/threonine-protein kinase [Thermoanaerobaculia bacterium]
MLTQAHVGRFEIRDFLGRGAIGDVYLAWDPKLASEVALKLVRTAKTDPEMVAAERNGTLLQDALAKVAPQVAAVYEQGDQDGFFWVAMEYVAGTDLAQVIEREAPFDGQRAVSIALQLCEMLEVFHELTTEGRRGIVHGDLKPENIRLQANPEGNDRVRVLDFGIAKHLSQTRRFTHNLFGSLPYTPPERLNSGRLDAQSDLWAVGVILYLMVSAYPPWSGQDPEELERRIRHGEPPVPLPEGVSPGLKKILFRALAFNPEQRYASAGALRADLEAWRDGRPVIEPPILEEPARDDLNATRRTSRPLDDSHAGETRRTDRPIASGLDATRRTYEPAAGVPPPAPPPPPPPLAEQLAAVPGPQPEVAARPRRRKRWLALAGALLIAFGASQFWIQGEAEELQRALATDTDPELLPILENYRKVSWLGMFNPSMGKVRDELREALVTSADRLIEGYHGDFPSTRERGWQKAYDHLKGAVELNYLDRKVRAKMYYAKAHLDRIESQTLKQKGDRPASSQKVDAAVAGFREAARRDKDWPDPYLGLARVYAYERPDLDQLQKSLVELEKRGYRLGKRERTMEGDGYRMRAEDLWARAQKARGTDAETDLLERTRDNLLQAINFYDDATGYADVRTNRAKAHDRLDQVQTRLRVLETPGFLDELFGIIVEEGRQGPDG